MSATNHDVSSSSSVTEPIRDNNLLLLINKIRGFLCCRRENKEQQEKPKCVSYKDLFRFATKKDMLCIMMGGVCACIAGLLQPAVLVIGGYIVSDFLAPEEKSGNDHFFDRVKWKLYLMVSCGVVAFIFTFAQTFLMKTGCYNLARTLRFQFLSSVLQKNAEWFDDTNSGVITTQLNENIERVENGLGDKLGLLLRGLAMFFSSITVCLVISWQTTLIMLPIGPLGAITMGFMGYFASGPAKEVARTSAEANCVAEESIMNVKTVASCNGQEHMVKKYETYLREALNPSAKYHFWVGLFEGFSQFELYLVVGIALCFHNGVLQNPGDALLVINTISITAWILGMLGPHFMVLQKVRIALAVIYDTIDKNRSIDLELGQDIEKPKGSVSFRNVQFTYASRKAQVLKDLTWSAIPGQSIALVGHSGCGKSTTMGLLTRLYEADEGAIEIDGIPIQDIKLKTLRKMIGIVSQEPVLFTGTVLDNIQLGRDGITKEDAIRAAHIAHADGFISTLSDDYDTLIGQGGVTLSGGQKQRIAIARAIVSNPKILLLDEATSALDTESEIIVQKALKQACVGRTSVIIAHRLSTLKKVDKIYVIDDGEVKEEGTHIELISKDGIYAKLCRSQAIHFDESSSLSMSDPNSSSLSNTPEPNETPAKPPPTEQKESSRNHLRGIKLLYTNLHGHYRNVVYSICVSFVNALEMPIAGLSFYLTFKGLEAQNEDEYKLWAYFAMVVSVANGILVMIALLFQHIISGKTAEGALVNFRVRVLKSLLHRSLSEFDHSKHTPVACVAALANHAPNCLAGLDFSMAQVTIAFFAVLIGFVASLVICWPMGIIEIALSVLMFGIVLANAYVSNNFECQRRILDKSGECAVEITEQARTIQLLNCERHFLEKYSAYQEQSIKFTHRVTILSAITFAASECFIFFSDCSCLTLATYLMYQGYVSADRGYLGYLGSSISGWAIMCAARYFPEIFRAFYSVAELFKMIDSEKSIKKRNEAGSEPEIEGAVELSDISFRYPNGTLAASGLSITAEPGEAIALVGASGCGKSTIINLLSAFYRTDEGRVLIDDFEIQNINLRHLRKNVALVGQEPVLFKGTILENITLGMEDLPFDAVVKACATANAIEFIMQFPQGYETNVGEKGRSLSGGQKQRIAIARALVRSPKILLLDEATSALDTESEKIVQHALEQASEGRTSITVAHRLSSIQHCSRIYVIHKRRVVENGTHEELIQLGGRYARLVEAQRLQ